MKTMIQTHLEQFGYDYTDHGEMLTVRLSLHVVIDLSEPDKIRLIDRLKSWHFLTGIIETRLKGALVYNTIGLFVISLIFIFLAGYVSDPAILILVFTALVGYILLWTLFYLIKAETFKQQVRTWMKEQRK